MNEKVKIELTPGKYRLKKTIENPKPDRRSKYDWRDLPEWKMGMKFLVEEKEFDQALTGDKTPPIRYRVLSRYGGNYSHQTLPVRAPKDKDDTMEMRFMALLPELEPISTENLGDIFSGNKAVEKHQSTELLAMLLDQKSVTFEEIRRAAEALQALDETGYDELCARHQIT